MRKPLVEGFCQGKLPYLPSPSPSCLLFSLKLRVLSVRGRSQILLSLPNLLPILCPLGGPCRERAAKPPVDISGYAFYLPAGQEQVGQPRKTLVIVFFPCTLVKFLLGMEQ